MNFVNTDLATRDVSRFGGGDPEGKAGARNLLLRIRDAVHRVADFTRIEG